MLTEEQLAYYEGVLDACHRTQDAADAFLTCPWYRPFRRSRLYRLMLKERQQMRQLKRQWEAAIR